MEILFVLCIGVLIGRFCFAKWAKPVNEKLQIACTMLLIFSMGVTLGRRPNFVEELATVGGQSLLFFFFPTVLSVVCVYGLSRRFFQKKGGSRK